MDKFFRLHIFAAEKVFYDGACDAIVVPTIDGKIGILFGHSNLMTASVPGIVEFSVPGEGRRLAVISEGILRVEKNEVWILTASAEAPGEIDRKRAQLAEQKAKELLKMKQSSHEYYAAQTKLARAQARLSARTTLDQTKL